MDPDRRIKRLVLLDEAIMFFTKGDWLGLKAPKDAAYHLIAGFTPTGLSVLKTTENPKSHTPLAEVSNDELRKGLGNLLSEILQTEIDPADPRFKNWTVLIPKSTSQDSPIAQKLFVEKGRTASIILAPLMEIGPDRTLHELFDIIPLADLSGRRFKWALAYPTRNWRKFSGQTLRWLHGWGGRYYMISNRKRTMLLRKNFGLA